MPKLKDFEHELKMYRVDAITAAKELGYCEGVIQQIEKAKSQDEISRIMTSARMKMT